MKIAVFSDAHGNRFYFDRCLEMINFYKVDKVYNLGDSFGYLRNGKYIFNKLVEMGATCLQGNHEAMLMGILKIDREKDKIYHLMDDKSGLDMEMLERLKLLVPNHIETINSKKVLFVHGNPIDPLTGYQYEDSNFEILRDIPFDIIFMGHTHRAYQKEVNGHKFINVGSCGLPRDIGNMPSFAIYDFENDSCEIIRCFVNKEEIEDNYQDINDKVYNCLYRNFTNVEGE